jgi:hypothetical protein
VNQEATEVDVSAFGDATQAAERARGPLSGDEAQIAREVPSGTEASEISDESDESGGGEKADTGDGEVSLNQGHLLCEGSELTLTGVNSAFELSDLRAGFGKEGAKGIRETGLGVFEGSPDVGDDVVSSEGNEDALLTKEPADRVDARGSILEPGRTETMKGP